jgi:hypothetical protein
MTQATFVCIINLPVPQERNDKIISQETLPWRLLMLQNNIFILGQVDIIKWESKVLQICKCTPSVSIDVTDTPAEKNENILP